MLRHEFQPTGVFLDSATYGLPPKVALQALSAVTAAWASGRYDPVSCDQAVGGARSTCARLHSVCAEDVAIGHQVSPMVGLIGRPCLREHACWRPRATSPRCCSAVRRRLRRAHDPAVAARRRGRQPHRPGGRLSRPIRRRTARRFGRHLQRSNQLLRTDVGRRHPRVRLAPARRRAVLTRGDGWVQMAMPPARDRVHDDRAQAARPDRPASRRLVRRRASLGQLLRNAPATRQRRPPLRRLPRLAELAYRRRHAGTVRSRREPGRQLLLLVSLKPKQQPARDLNRLATHPSLRGSRSAAA